MARGSDAARLAEPLQTVAADQAVEQLVRLVSQLKAAGIVVGLPRGLDGQDTSQTRYARDWAQRAKAQIELPFYWQDEALTSQKAESLSPQAKSPGSDAEAAAIILQDFLDTPESEWVRC